MAELETDQSLNDALRTAWHRYVDGSPDAPLLAAILYAVSPLTMRYALEARPYAQAACWSAFSTVVFLSLVRKPSFGKAARSKRIPKK